MKALINVATFDLEQFCPDQFVLFDQAIVARGAMADFPGADEVCDLRGRMLLPGLVLGHGHIYSTLARGWSTPFAPRSFRQLLEQLWWKLDAELDADAVYYSGLVAGMDCIRNGITTLIDHHASGRIIQGSLATLKRAVCDQVGLRGIFCFETSDRFPVDQCIAENLDFAAACPSAAHPGMAAGLFGLHASMTLSTSTLAAVARQRGRVPVHIHVAESAEDQTDSLAQYGVRVVRRLDDAGLLDAGSLLAHCIHVDTAERAIMAKRGVRVALNLASNMNNAVGLPDYVALRSAGIPVVLGNDGLGFNLGRDIQTFLFAARQQAQSPTGVDLDDVKTALRSAWDYAGQCLGCRLGRIAAGYQADFMAVPYDPPTPLTDHNALGHWFYGLLDSLRPDHVWVAGQAVLADNQLQADEPIIRSEARKVSTALWKRLETTP